MARGPGSTAVPHSKPSLHPEGTLVLALGRARSQSLSETVQRQPHTDPAVKPHWDSHTPT